METSPKYNLSLTTTGTSGAATHDSSSGVLNIPQYASAEKSFGYQTRALNTCFLVSASRDAAVSYGVDISASLTLTSGELGTVYLETFTDSGCTTGTQEVCRVANGQTGSLAVGATVTQNVTSNLTGVVPAGKYVKLRTENNTGSPVFTARPGQETLL